MSRIANFGVLGIAGLAAISLAYTANLGGKIRHTELRSNVETGRLKALAEVKIKEND